MRRIIVGISGASGVIYGVRLLEVLRGVEEIETHVVVSPAARRTLALETDFPAGHIEALADTVYKPGDIAAAISSGSFLAAGMIVAPCSIKTVAGIATSYSDNLLLRAADVTLKERRTLVLLVRETPLHLGHLRLLVQVAELGAVVMPPMPAFYHRPQTLQEVIDQTVNRALDMLGVELDHDLFSRWHGPPTEPAHRSLKAGTFVAVNGT
jgi:4-hydroxy-3-polyprenylbenzoate decarboxylase